MLSATFKATFMSMGFKVPLGGQQVGKILRPARSSHLMGSSQG